jgi:hypothetical protein
MDTFLPPLNSTAKFIGDKADELYHRLKDMDADSLGMADHCLTYFKSSHSQRLFFSIETSAHLLYRAINITQKKISDIVLVDYGAGVGTLFLLAKMIGCRRVIYNDHLEDWRESAELIANAISINIDQYIVGDIDVCLDELKDHQITCDIIATRNVVEHIYKLDQFYDMIYNNQPSAVIYSSTTANKSNPASVLKHRLWHRKWEKVFWGKRLSIIRRRLPEIPVDTARRLATATRGQALEDLDKAIVEFSNFGKLPKPEIYGSNTCDPSNGVWAENLLSSSQYRDLINVRRYDVHLEAGFWDTHYSKWYMNVAGRILNKIIRNNKQLALRLAPFIYVVAIPSQSRLL